MPYVSLSQQCETERNSACTSVRVSHLLALLAFSFLHPPPDTWGKGVASLSLSLSCMHTSCLRECTIDLCLHLFLRLVLKGVSRPHYACQAVSGTTFDDVFLLCKCKLCVHCTDKWVTLYNIRLHCMHHISLDVACCYTFCTFRDLYVSLYVCVLGVRMRPTKMVEPVEILFRGCVGPRNHRWGCTLAPPAGRDWMSHVWQWCSLLSDRPMWAQECCRISPPHFLAECSMRQLNQGNFVLLYFRLFTFSDLCWVCLSAFSCTVLFVSISQVIGCEDRLWNDLYCVEWGVKLYSNQPTFCQITLTTCCVLVQVRKCQDR